MRRVGLGLLFVLAGCSPPARPPEASEGYPGVLHPPAELTPDFVVEQHVEATRGNQSGGFDAVLQKRGGELRIVGLGPMGVRAFVLEQVGVDARFEQTMGPPLPFPPKNILIDIHRAFFKRLPLREAEAQIDGPHVGRIDDEDVTEIWQGGSLAERRFARPDRVGVVSVRYERGCTFTQCEPESLRLVNAWFGYTLRIENRRYQRLP